MNTLPAMKLIALFSRVALTGLAAFLLGVVLDTQPLALFGVAASTLLLLIVVTDYAPDLALTRSRPADIVPFAPQPADNEADTKLAA